MRRQPRSWFASFAAGAALIGALVCAAPAGAAVPLEALAIDPAWVRINTAPASAPAVIRGLGFTPSSTVTFDGIAATVTFVDSRTLNVQVPTSATGKVARVLVSDAGDSDEIFPFIYTAGVLYVKPAGNDQGNGTTPGTAKKTITAALNAVSGTTTTLVHVAEGTYPERDLAVFSGVVVAGGWDAGFTQRDPDQFVTVVDAGGAGFAMRTGGLDASQVIDGLTIRNGVRDGFGGGGLVISADNTVLSNSVIVGNTSSSRGGGAYAVFTTTYGGKPVFSRNVMLGNRTFSNSGGAVGIYPFYTQGQIIDVAISDNYILGNRSFNSRGGGIGVASQALYTYNVLRLQVVGNTVAENRALSGGGTSIVASGGSDNFDLVYDNNLLFGNSASGQGGGLYLGGMGRIDGRVSGSTLHGNAAGLDGGGGIHFGTGLTYEPGFVAENLISWNNLNGNVSGAPVVTFSVIQGGAPGAGNIALDPAFSAGPMGAFYLAQDANAMSPAVDAGSDLAVSLSMENVTTSAALSADAGLVDMGFHYPTDVTPSGDPIALLRLDPAAGDLGGSDWTLIRGRGFDPGAGVTFDGVPAVETIYVSDRRILARPPAHAMGAVDVVVTNADQTSAALAGGYAFIDNLPPAWPVTVGLQSVGGKQDCVRTAVLTWNPAVDAVSSPVRYSIHREVCMAPDPGDFRNPCSNISFIPDQTNFVTTTTESFYVDTNFGSGGADPKYIYLVRAADSATPTSNREFNYSKRVVTVSKITGDLTPPAPVGNTLVIPAAGPIDWEGAVGAVDYNLYRQASGSDFANPGSLVPFATLTTLNNDLDGNGVTDSSYNDPAVPAPGAAFFYRVTALDACGNETVSELVP